MNTPIIAIVETVASERDSNGNTYHFARFYNAKKGRSECVTLETGGEGNATYLARKLTGDWEKVLSFSSVIPKRDWQRAHKALNPLYEGSPEAKKALQALFDTKVELP